MTMAINGLFGRWIVETPKRWLCVKRRQPTAHCRGAG
jgi:hypothetical protein